MKEFIKGRWFPLIVAIIAVIIVVYVVFLFGWRITYAPDLENSWEAVSAVATWVGVAISFVAIIVAGIVAWRQNEISKKQADIADKQNKIALFEKRYELYKIVSDCKFFAEITLEFAETPSDIYDMFYMGFDMNIDVGTKPDRAKVTPEILSIIKKLEQARFLFSKNISVLMEELAFNILRLMNADILKESDDEFQEKKDIFCKTVEKFSEKEILKEMERALLLQ